LGKLKALSGREVCRILASHGFQEVRRRGSHVLMQLKREATTITVPVPDHARIRIGTLRSIIRQSGLPRSEFE
jgi:predicted RNA binding protein YcfA (HicA-like mRNA interferase family)